MGKEKKLKKPFKFETDDELDSLMDEASSVKGTSDKEPANLTVAKNNSPIHFEITEQDDELTIATKNIINESGITLQDIYDKRGQRNGYNMKYSVQKKGQLGWDRVKTWCKLLHLVPIIQFRKMTPAEIELAEKEFEKERNNLKK